MLVFGQGRGYLRARKCGGRCCGEVLLWLRGFCSWNPRIGCAGAI